MSIFLGIVAAVVGILLAVVTAAVPARQPYTKAELKRRVERSASGAIELDRLAARASLTTLLRLKQAVLLVLLGFLFVALFGWLNGVLLTIAAAILYPLVARVKFIRVGAGKVYAPLEPWLLSVAIRFKKAILVFREPSLAVNEPTRKVYSKEDLAEIIGNSEDVIGPNERALVAASLVFFDRPVREVMTVRDDIKTIKHSEFLGPLVLDELHAIGHSRLPVIAGSIDKIVGVLHLRELLSLDIRHSVTAEKAMDKKVHYIKQDDTLEHALSGFMKHRHHFFIVVDDEHTTVGILTLEDTIEALVGRKIMSGHADH